MISRLYLSVCVIRPSHRPVSLATAYAKSLNMVAIEIGVLRGQCLDRRIADRHQLVAEIAAWQRQRNDAGARINWMFTTERARTKMARAYPPVPNES